MAIFIGKPPDRVLTEEALDPDDNFLIAICESGSANNLVTGDQRAGLLERTHIGATEILTAAQIAERYVGWHIHPKSRLMRPRFN